MEKWAARGRIDFWVRNLVRKPCSSFYLQTAEGRFYPDFVCRLPDKTTLVVEYKGADRYAAARMDRDMGELWAELSDGKCRFVMATDKKWGGIEGEVEVKNPPMAAFFGLKPASPLNGKAPACANRPPISHPLEPGIHGNAGPMLELASRTKRR